MTREEKLDWLYRLKSEIFVLMPKEWIKPMSDALGDVIKALEQEPTTKNNLGVDCISREQAIEEADKLCLETGYDNEKVIEMLNELPSVTPIRPKGHWTEEFNDLEGEVRFTCSSCGKYQLFGTDFCYHCGAKMVELQESEVKNGGNNT